MEGYPHLCPLLQILMGVSVIVYFYFYFFKNHIWVLMRHNLMTSDIALYYIGALRIST